MADLSHKKWPKIPRLFRDCEITEKIDGTNAVVLLTDGQELSDPDTALPGFTKNGTPDIEVPGTGPPHKARYIFVGSRRRWLTKDEDNFGFWQWVADRAEQFHETLPNGRYYGEFWGHGIQRGYDMPNGERRLALFDTSLEEQPLPEGVDTVPVLYYTEFSTLAVENTLWELQQYGSRLVPGYNQPEGVVVRHIQSGHRFKVTLDEVQ